MTNAEALDAARDVLAEYDRSQPNDYERAYAQPLADALRALIPEPRSEHENWKSDPLLDGVAQALCAVEVLSKAATLEEVADGIQRWTRHRYEAERLVAELRDYGIEARLIPEPTTDDEREALDLEDVREAFTASDRWDGDEAEQSIILRFISHYSALDREIDAARAADDYNDDAPIWFQWDDERGSLVHRHRGPITDEVRNAAREAARRAWVADLNQKGTDLHAIVDAALEAAEAARQ